MTYFRLMRLYTTILAMIFALSVYAQQSTVDSRIVGIVYQQEWYMSAQAHTAGLSLAFAKGELKNYYTTTYKKIEFGYVRHPKEFRQSLQSASGGVQIFVPGSSYVYGKQNSFLFLSGLIGRKRYFSEKTKRKGIAVGFSYEFGPSLGILKPYYLEINRDNEVTGLTQLVELKYSEENEDLFLDRSAIRGHSGFFRGLGELNFTVGGQARAAIHLAPGAYESFVRAMDVGVMIQAYTSRVPIMIIEDNKYVFVNLFLSFQLGQRS